MVGTGYVGLVSGTCFAETGIKVSCVDVDKTKIDNLNKGILPIWEPGLENMVSRNVEKGKLTFSTSLKDNLDGVDVVFSAVGTPPDEDGSADLKYVLGVAREVGKNIDHYMVIITKSTVPVGTSAKVKKAIQEGADVFVSSDFKYHEFFDAENKIIIADIGHFESEVHTKDLFFDLISKEFPSLKIQKCHTNTNPVQYFI